MYFNRNSSEWNASAACVRVGLYISYRYTIIICQQIEGEHFQSVRRMVLFCFYEFVNAWLGGCQSNASVGFDTESVSKLFFFIAIWQNADSHSQDVGKWEALKEQLWLILESDSVVVSRTLEVVFPWILFQATSLLSLRLSPPSSRSRHQKLDQPRRWKGISPIYSLLSIRCRRRSKQQSCLVTCTSVRWWLSQRYIQLW